MREIAFQLERAAEPTYRVRAFRRAAQVVSDLPAGELEQRVRDGTLEALPGIGKVTAEVITQATTGQQPAYLARVLAEAPASEPTALRAALRGDCHTHSDGPRSGELQSCRGGGCLACRSSPGRNDKRGVRDELSCLPS